MKVALSCGGTGGHIFPGLATAGILRRRGHEVTLWLAGKKIEGAAVGDWDGPVETVYAEGLPTAFSMRFFTSAWMMFRAAAACRQRMERNPPDVMLAMGSYASAGPVTAALRLRIPVVMHEANVIPGRAVQWFARRATRVAASFEETRYYLRRIEIDVTGLPLRRELQEAAESSYAYRSDLPATLLVMGGSGGAHRLNELATAAVARLWAKEKRVRVIHITGRADEAVVREAYRRIGVPHEVFAFTTDMAPLYRQATLGIFRAGAATCAELAAFGVPALLVPYPHAVRDHQLANARALEKAGAADAAVERDLSPEWLAGYLLTTLHDPGRLQTMSAAGRACFKRNGAEALADVVEAAARGQGRG